MATAMSAVMAVPALAQTEITWWHAMGGQLGETVNALAEKFNAAQSDYKITPIYKGSYEETMTAGIAAFRANEQPNIIQIYDAGAATIIGAEGAVIPAQTLMSENGVSFDINDYISGVRYFYADTDGTMIGMPFNSSTPILYYNEEALEKAGVTPPKTWEEFESVTAPALKEAGFVPLAQSHLPWIFTENFFSRHNLEFASLDNGYETGTPIMMMNTDPIKMHFTNVKQWLDDGYFGWYGTGWADNQKPFSEGQVAMWLGSSASFGGLRQSATFPFSATNLPYWESLTQQPYQTFIGGAALFAMSGKPAEENKAVAEFFSFLTSPEIQYFWHKETGYVPVTTAAYDLAKKEGYYKETPQAEVGIEQLNQRAGDFTKGYRLGFYVQIRDVMNREYAKILTDESNVDDAFELIETESNQLLERFSRTLGN
ncbi:MAG: extracellular solute-binding protein [Pseudomonadota bacterium]